MIKRVGLIITDDDMKLLEAGDVIRTNGILRTKENMEIYKHLPIIDVDKTSWEELGDALKRVFKENKKEVAIVTGIGIGIVSAVAYFIHRKGKKEKEQQIIEAQYNEWLNGMLKDYLNEVREGNINVHTINTCITALESIPNMTKGITISLNEEQTVELLTRLSKYTRELAQINNYIIDDNESLNSNKFVDCFLNNMKIQRSIINAA